MADLDGVLDEAIPDSIVIGNREDIRPWWTDEFLTLRFGGVGIQEAGTLYERFFARKCITEIWPSKAIFSDSTATGFPQSQSSVGLFLGHRLHGRPDYCFRSR